MFYQQIQLFFVGQPLRLLLKCLNDSNNSVLAYAGEGIF